MAHFVMISIICLNFRILGGRLKADVHAQSSNDGDACWVCIVCFLKYRRDPGFFLLPARNRDGRSR